MNLEQPKIHVELLKTISNFGPAQQANEGDSLVHDRLVMSAKLSFFDIVPSGPESKSRAPTQPYILAGYSYLTDNLHTGGEQFTIICRLGISAAKPALHSSFDHLSLKRASSRTELSVRDFKHSLVRS